MQNGLKGGIVVEDDQEVLRLVAANGEILRGDVVIVDNETLSTMNRTTRACADHQSDQGVRNQRVFLSLQGLAMGKDTHLHRRPPRRMPNRLRARRNELRHRGRGCRGRDLREPDFGAARLVRR